MNIKINIPSFERVLLFPFTLEFIDDSPYLIIQGSNGCGKSTVFNILCGIKSDDGYPEIVVDGKYKYYPVNDKRLIRYVPQVPEEALFSNLSIGDNLKMLGLVYNIKSIISICNDLHLDENMVLWHLSVGLKKMLLFRVIKKSLPEPNNFGETPVIILFDEPFAGLDKDNKEFMFNHICQIATEYENCPLKIIVIDHMNIVPENPAVVKNVELRHGVELKITAAKTIVYKMDVV